MRPILNKQTGADEFILYYWLKEELVSFCKEQGLSTGGSKGAYKKGFGIFEARQRIAFSKNKDAKASEKHRDPFAGCKDSGRMQK